MINRHDGSQTAIQMKRRSRRNKHETVATIREFVGALIIEGFVHGVFVTAQRLTRESPILFRSGLQAGLAQALHLTYGAFLKSDDEY